MPRLSTNGFYRNLSAGFWHFWPISTITCLCTLNITSNRKISAKLVEYAYFKPKFEKTAANSVEKFLWGSPTPKFHSVIFPQKYPCDLSKYIKISRTIQKFSPFYISTPRGVVPLQKRKFTRLLCYLNGISIILTLFLLKNARIVELFSKIIIENGTPFKKFLNKSIPPTT